MKKHNRILIYVKMSLRTFRERPSWATLKGIIQYFPSWWQYLRPARNSVSDHMPWISFPAINFLIKNLTPDMRLFEYGSGGSTLFWSARVKEVICVEHNPTWYQKISNEFRSTGLDNIDYILQTGEADEHFQLKSPDNPGDYISSDALLAGQSFEKYVRQIDRFPDGYFNVVIIDGRARPSCIEHAQRKVDEGGFMIVDNSERDHYSRALKLDKKKWIRKDFAGPAPYNYHFSTTTIFIKDSSPRN
jgi:hypothetical protein